jgi:hypothetical protein
MGESTFSSGQHSIPEVVNLVSNPFFKNNLNYAVKNQKPLITPKMEQAMRF